jgi:hypothetical protein
MSIPDRQAPVSRGFFVALPRSQCGIAWRSPAGAMPQSEQENDDRRIREAQVCASRSVGPNVGGNRRAAPALANEKA